MTAIIVVVVVALVFFVAVCVIALMVWKRESEMRTDSIKAIEENLERLAQELSHESDDADGLRRETEKLREAFADRNVKRNIKEDLAYVESVMSEREQGGTGRSGSWDPFDWVRGYGNGRTDGRSPDRARIRSRSCGRTT